MIGAQCRRVGRLIDARRQGLSEAEQLTVEAHSQQCARCRGHAQLLDAVMAATTAPAPTLGEPARARVIRRALAAAAREEAAPRRLLPRAWAWVPPALACVALAAVALRDGPPPAPPTGPTSGDDASAVADVTRTTAREEAASGGTHDTSPPVLRLGHARVTPSRDARWRWDEQAARVWLDAGALAVEVDPRPHRPFAVATPHFTVEVLGTAFSVDLDTVQVTRGRVRVRMGTARDTRLWELGAGERWRRPSAASARHAPDAQRGGGARTRRRAPAKRLGRATSAAPRSPRPAQTWLTRAREALAAGDASAAEGHLRAAQKAPGTHADRAEAALLRAEIARHRGRPRRALEAYLDAAARYRGSATGQSALFAAAQLATRQGWSERARELLRTYLARYPRGRFAQECRQRLGHASPSDEAPAGAGATRR